METVPTMSDNGILAHYSALPNQEGAGVQTTLDISNRENQALLSQAVSGGGPSIWDLPEGTVIAVQHLAAHFGEWTDPKTGEEKKGTILTLFGPDGAWHTGSEYAFRDLQLIGRLRGRPPWDPPLKLLPKHADTRNGNTRQAIVLAE